MHLASISELSEFTGHDRATIRGRLTTLQPKEIKGKALLYESSKACRLIFLEGTPLENEAKAARHREAIDNAEMTRLRRETEEQKSISKRDVVDGVADLATKVVQIVKQSKLSESEKRQAIGEIAEIRSRWE